MNLNFVLSECTFLRSFIPLIIEANKRNLISNMFLIRSNKYTSPHIEENFKQIYLLQKQHNFSLHEIDDLKDYDGITFFIENSGISYLVEKHKNISITYAIDFTSCYEHYIDKVDHVLFPSKFFAEYYNKQSDKNLYLGLPKYDISFNRKDILKKYIGVDKEPAKKIALILYPRLRDANLVNLDSVYKLLHDLNFALIVKTRGKDPVDQKHYGDLYVTDYTWYPHSTMELLEISDLVMNFDSCAIKECVMSNVPVMNYSVKPERKLEFFYNYDFTFSPLNKLSDIETNDRLNKILFEDLSKEFELAIKNHMFENIDVCKKILDVII